jgi:hypothetical protein
MAGFEGGCLCGHIRYRVEGAPLAALACHCRDCQYVSGGAEANVLVVPTAALLLQSGKQQVYHSLAASGTAVWRSFCPNCGTPLFAGNAKHPQATVVKVGTLDDAAGFKRQGHIWMASAPPWHLIEPDVPAVPANPASF